MPDEVVDDDDGPVIKAIKRFVGLDRRSALKRGDQSYDEIVDDASTGDRDTASNAGPQSQSSDASNKY